MLLNYLLPVRRLLLNLLAWRPRIGRRRLIGRFWKHVSSRQRGGGVSKQRKRNWIAGPAALVGVMMLWTAACDDDSATGLQPDELPESQLTFIPRSSAAPPLVTMTRVVRGLVPLSY